MEKIDIIKSQGVIGARNSVWYDSSSTSPKLKIFNNASGEWIDSGIPLVGSNSIVVSSGSSPEENLVNLKSAYNMAKQNAIKYDKKYTVVIPPGTYGSGNDNQILFDSKHVSVVSLTGNPDVIFNGDVTINPEFDYSPVELIFKGLNCTGSLLYYGQSLLITVENCVAFGPNSFGCFDETITDESFVLSGKFINCLSNAQYSFGVVLSTCQVPVVNMVINFKNCSGTSHSFMHTESNVPVYSYCTFDNCNADMYSFGSSVSDSAHSSIIWLYNSVRNCTASHNSFGWVYTQNISDNSTYDGCRAISNSFTKSESASYGDGLPTYINCHAKTSSFQYGVNSIRGYLYYCSLSDSEFSARNYGLLGSIQFCFDSTGTLELKQLPSSGSGSGGGGPIYNDIVGLSIDYPYEIYGTSTRFINCTFLDGGFVDMKSQPANVVFESCTYYSTPAPTDLISYLIKNVSSSWITISDAIYGGLSNLDWISAFSNLGVSIGKTNGFRFTTNSADISYVENPWGLVQPDNGYGITLNGTVSSIYNNKDYILITNSEVNTETSFNGSSFYLNGNNLTFTELVTDFGVWSDKPGLFVNIYSSTVNLYCLTQISPAEAIINASIWCVNPIYGATINFNHIGDGFSITFDGNNWVSV